MVDVVDSSSTPKLLCGSVDVDAFAACGAMKPPMNSFSVSGGLSGWDVDVVGFAVGNSKGVRNGEGLLRRDLVRWDIAPSCEGKRKQLEDEVGKVAGWQPLCTSKKEVQV